MAIILFRRTDGLSLLACPHSKPFRPPAGEAGAQTGRSIHGAVAVSHQSSVSLSVAKSLVNLQQRANRIPASDRRVGGHEFNFSWLREKKANKFHYNIFLRV